MGKFKRLSKCRVAEEAAPPVAAGMKRKGSCGEEYVPRRRNFAESTAAASIADEPNASCCSSKRSVEVDDSTSNTVDLEEEKEKTDELETSTYKLDACGKRNETTPLPDEAPVEQAEAPEIMKSTPPPKATPPSSQENSRRELTDGSDSDPNKPPTKAELEDFFAKAEAQIHQEFAKKYNFDVTKEKPLPGRFEWVRVEP